MRQSYELEVKRIQQEHAEDVKSERRRYAEIERSLGEQLREKDKFLQEYRQFLKVCSCVGVFCACFIILVIMLDSSVSGSLVLVYFRNSQLH